MSENASTTPLRAARGFPLVRGTDLDGPRDFLDGVPVHCGTGPRGRRRRVPLLLICTEVTGPPVRVAYEADLSKQDGWAWIYVIVAGFAFRAPLLASMRFCWPSKVAKEARRRWNEHRDTCEQCGEAAREMCEAGARLFTEHHDAVRAGAIVDCKHENVRQVRHEEGQG